MRLKPTALFSRAAAEDTAEDAANDRVSYLPADGTAGGPRNAFAYRFPNRIGGASGRALRFRIVSLLFCSLFLSFNLGLLLSFFLGRGGA